MTRSFVTLILLHCNILSQKLQDSFFLSFLFLKALNFILRTKRLQIMVIFIKHFKWLGIQGIMHAKNFQNIERLPLAVSC